jgi:hypothetical protein
MADVQDAQVTQLVRQQLDTLAADAATIVDA